MVRHSEKHHIINIVFVDITDHLSWFRDHKLTATEGIWVGHEIIHTKFGWAIEYFLRKWMGYETDIPDILE